jgi:hypothetical protein
MRSLISFLLCIVFSLNAAHAAVAGVCDALDHFPQGESEQHLHVSHHSHNLSEAGAEEHANGDQDTPQGKKSAGGHCHAHSTTATAVTSSGLVSSPAMGRHVLVALPASPVISFIPAGLDRPPRDFLA